MFNFFSRRKHFDNAIKVDIHSHLLPHLDDGVKSFEESIAILKAFEDMGYQKIITTPHIMKEYYDNTRDTIAEQYEALTQKIIEEKLNIEVEFAAEYYLDEFFLEKLSNKEPLLHFGENFVLVETSFYNPPVFLKDVFFQMHTLGYKPVLAHPERYIYLYNHSRMLDELMDMQIYFQINLGSLVNYYGSSARKLANSMLDKNYVHFLGSDCHNLHHLEIIRKTLKSKSYQSISFDNLLNNRLLGDQQ